uniref:Uncharacterized protein n=1 Tax=Panagrolaimus sp. PS1159 TaxID=55785 RepID=A0AC35G898_9BILA
MLRKALTQVTTKPSDAEQIMEACQQLSQTNEQSNPIEKEVASWIDILETLGKRPEDVPPSSEISKLSTMQIEELWIRVGMIKETLSAVEIAQVNAEKTEKMVS